MTQKDTPPSSPDMNNQVEEDDILYIGDVDEVIDAFDSEDAGDEDAMDEDLAEGGNAICVFSGHKRGKGNSRRYGNVNTLNDCDFI